MGQGVRARQGRAAVYAPLWQRAIRTPVRAVITALVLIGLIVGVGSVLGGRETPTPPPSSAPSSAPSFPPSSTGASPGGVTSPRGPAPTVPSSSRPPLPSPTAEPAPLLTPRAPAGPAPGATAGDPAATATGWSREWFDHASPQQWIDGLQPYTTEEFLGVLGTVDVSQLPGGQVTGPARVAGRSPASATVLVPTSALTLQVSVVRTSDGWRVASADRAS